MSAAIGARGTDGSTWWVMCFWYCTGVATGPLVSSSTTRAGSVDCEAITSSRPGWSRPVAAR